MSNVLIQEYISLAWSTFKVKHKKKDLDAFLDTIADLEFEEQHLAHRDLEALSQSGVDRNKALKQIAEELEERGFDEENYIPKYLQELEKNKPADHIIRMIKTQILKYYLYNNKRLEVSDLRRTLNQENLTTVNVDKQTKSMLKEQLKLYISTNTNYTIGLQSLLDELDDIPSQQDSTKIGRKISSISNIDPKNRKDRKDLYEFYEELHPLYIELKNSIKEVLTLWDRVEEYEGQFHTRETEEYIEDIDEELEELQQIYNAMDDDLNYIITSEAIPYTIITDRDTQIGQNIKGLSIEKFQYLLGEEAAGLIEDVIDDEPEWDEFGEQDTGTYIDEEGGKERKTPQADTSFEQSPAQTEMDDSIREMFETFIDIDIVERVDPLFAIAAEQGILKKKYSIKSWEKTRDGLLEQIEQSEKLNPGVVSQYQEILDEHEEFQEQAIDTKELKDTYYFPITESSLKILEKYTDLNVPFTEIENLHTKIVTLIMDILEEPLNKTTLPYHIETEDFAPGQEQQGKQKIPRAELDRMKEQFNLFSRVNVGKKGKKKEKAAFGKFAESLMEMFEIANEYYGSPIKELMLPFKSVPKYLDADTLAALINHGAEGTGQLMLDSYRDFFIGFVTPRDIDRLNEYMITSNSAKHNVTNMENKADGVLNVLEKLAPNNKENDLNWFANEFKEMAKRDSSFDIEGVQLQNKRIDDLTFNRRKHKTAYHQVLWLINKFSGHFKKNPYTRKEIRIFLNEYKQQSDDKKASVAQTKVLAAHDEIRKMIGKPIYYNTCQIDSFDHISDTMDIIKEDHRIELNGTDIIGIVTDFDSMENIAKKFGTNSDVVYHVKALYR